MSDKNAYGGVVISGGNRVLLRESTNHYGGYAWTFAKAVTASGAHPEETALKAVKEKTGYSCTVRAKIPGTFASKDFVSNYFLMEASHPPDAHNWQTSRLRWAHFDEARDLIRQSSNEEGRVRDLAVLDAAFATLDTIPYDQHLAVHPEDWGGTLDDEIKLQPMPERHITLTPIGIWYSADDMVKIRRGFYPTVMEQKWFLFFTGNRLRMHRSWTGVLIFDVGFAWDSQGGAYIRDVIANRDQNQYGLSNNDEDLLLVQEIIRDHLLNSLEAPAQDGMALALQQALQPNYLGSPNVVGKLILNMIDVAARDFFADIGVRENVREDFIFQSSVNADVNRGKLVRDTVQALSGMDDNYTSMPSWHSPDELGWNVMLFLAPKVNFTGYESLYEIVFEGIKQVIDKAYELLMAYDQNPDIRWDEHLLPDLQELHQFVTTVFLGTNAVAYGKRTLNDFQWNSLRR